MGTVLVASFLTAELVAENAQNSGREGSNKMKRFFWCLKVGFLCASLLVLFVRLA
jgi:hypothetical protein